MGGGYTFAAVSRPQVTEEAEAILLAIPGLIHSLGNALFAIQGHGQRVGITSPDLEAEKAAILRAVGQAQGGLEVLRHLADGAHRPAPAGILLHRLCEILKLPVRDHGLRLELQQSSRQSPETVDGTLLCRALATTIGTLVTELPPGLSGSLSVDLVSQTEEHLDILVRVETDGQRLPFPLGLENMARTLGRRLAGSGAELLGPEPENTLRLRLPTTPTGAEGQPCV